MSHIQIGEQTHIQIGEQIRPQIPALLLKSQAKDLNLQFMLLHVHCADYVNGEMKYNKGDSPFSKYQDSSEYVFDEESDERPLFSRIVLFGCTIEGNSVCISVKNYRPWIRVQVQENLSESEVRLLQSFFEKQLEKIDGKQVGTVQVKLENRKQFYGWQPDLSDPSKTRTFSYAKISFDSFFEATKAANKCKQSYGAKPPFVLDLVDTQIKANSRFCNDYGIVLSDWVLLQKSSLNTISFYQSNWESRFSNCQIEIECEDVSLLSPLVDNRIAPLLIASIDGEMYSEDGSFPDYLKGDTTIFIGLSLWFYGTPLKTIQRIMFCVSDNVPTAPLNTDDTELMKLFIFKTSREMFEGFRDFCIACDPDIITGWNTFGFDYPFLYGEYIQSYLPQGERGSEKLQLALLNHVPSSFSNLNTSLETAAELLNKVRGMTSQHVFSNWVSKINYSIGISNVNSLIKEEKLWNDKRGTSKNLSTFSGGLESSSLFSSFSDSKMIDDEEEDEEYISSTGLSAFAAKQFRTKLSEDFTRVSECGKWDDAFTLVKRMDVVNQTEFKKNIQVNFSSSISNMLLQKRPSKFVQRGLFLSRFASEKSILVEKRMSSAARGDNIYSYIHMTGRINIDLMQIIKDDKKPESNTLKYASKTFLGQVDQEKIDLSASEMFADYKSGDLTKRWKIAEYCARDCDIPLLLISKLSYVPTWIEMSRVCYTSFHDVVNSGQQVKVMNLIARFVKDDYALNLRDSGWPDNEIDDDDETSFRKTAPDYEGATVIEPATGFYEDCVSTLDFESLYPSIIRYFNLCPSTLILDKEVLDLESKTQGKVSFEKHVIKNNVLVNKKLLKYEYQDRIYTFAMHITGVLPSLLKRLIEARKAVKKLMNESKDPAEKAVLNGRQNGLKVACNSCYGFCGVSKKKGLMPCKPVAAVTTLKGRLFIDFSKNFTEKTYPGAKVIYGDTDSVMVLWGKGTTVERANELGEEAASRITSELREGKVTEIGGAGSLSASILSSSVEWRGRKDLAEACSAVRLTNEKVYFPYLLLKKKNYAAIKFTSDGKGGFKEELDMKGIDAVRRDRSQLVRDASNAILHSLLYERSVTSAMIVLKTQLQDMVDGKISVDAFVLSKSLKSNYSSSNLPHVMAWKRMLERGDEGAPPIGARMPYVILSDLNGLGGKETLSKMYERSEHPEFAKKCGRRLDYPYYIESLFNPVQKLLQFCNIQDLKKIFKEAKELASNNLKNVTTLKRFMTIDNFNLSSSSNFSSSNFTTTKSQESLKTQKSNKKVKKEEVPKLKQPDLSSFFK
jgi:DNA polymerase elongation subunit (family B)